MGQIFKLAHLQGLFPLGHYPPNMHFLAAIVSGSVSDSFRFKRSLYHLPRFFKLNSSNQAVLAEIGASEGVTKMMFLAICYSANVGGTGTLIGGSSLSLFQ